MRFMAIKGHEYPRRGFCTSVHSLDKELETAEIAKCLRKLKNNKTGGSEGLVGELLKNGGSGMVSLLESV